MNDAQSNEKWIGHTCAPETVPDLDNCDGCKQRAELHLQPLSSRARAAGLAREEFERGPTYAAFGVGGGGVFGMQIWLAVCSWCGGVVLDNRLSTQMEATRDKHTEWHKRNAWH